jgi:hypothetical protein
MKLWLLVLSALEIAALPSTKMSVNLYHTTRHHIQEVASFLILFVNLLEFYLQWLKEFRLHN